MKANKYHGDVAKNYDRTRTKDGTWAAEHALIEKLLAKGPVLDVPFGTGRYVPIYESKKLEYLGIDISADMLAEAKAKCPQANCKVGSVFDLPTGFETVVCTRLLNWLYPDELESAMAQMSGAAETMIFSARTGIDGDRRGTATYTHSTTTLKQLIGGRLWEQHKIGNLRHGEYIMVKARKPVWADVEKAFADRPRGTIERLLQEWAPRVGVEVPVVSPQTKLTVEWWTNKQLGDYIDLIAKTDPAMRTDRLPRDDAPPMVAFKCKGKYGLIDGRRRANKFRFKPGVYPVIVMEV